MDFLSAALAWPTGIFTLLLCLAVLYWLFVILGALDIHLLSFGHGAGEGVAEGITEGAMEGAAHGVAHGVTDGVADGVAEGAAHGGHHEGPGGDDEGFLAGIFATLNLRAAPVTVVLTLIILFAWLGSFFGMRLLAGFGLVGVLVAVGVGIGAFVLALPLTSLAVRPLAPLFKTAQARSRSELLGATCSIATGWVDERFGQANVQIGSDHLLIQVRCRTGNALRKGDEALIVDFDAAREVYLVEPMKAT